MYEIIPEKLNPALRKKAELIPLDQISGGRIKELVKDMRSLLSKEEYGVALAAPQVGVAIKLFIVSGTAVKKRQNSGKRRKKSDDAEDAGNAGMPLEDQVYINPELLKVSRAKKDKHEGCLSIRGKWGVVPRAEKATIRAYDENGRIFTRGASGFLAHIFQHEIDHLEGILYTDKAIDVYDDEADSAHEPHEHEQG